MSTDWMDTKVTPLAVQVLGGRGVQFLAQLGLCAAYLQGGIDKALDFQSAIGEMQHFGISPAAPLAVIVIVLELGASIMILSGFYRWIAALALAVFTLAATFLAARYWELPMGQERFMAANTFYEHLGLVGGFVLVAGHDLVRRKQSFARL